MFNSITYYKKTVQLVTMLYTRSFCLFKKSFLNYVLPLTFKSKPNILKCIAAGKFLNPWTYLLKGRSASMQEHRERLRQLAPDPPALTEKKFYHRRSKMLDSPGEIAASKLCGPQDQKKRGTPELQS